jgi:hypothetical protein
MPNQSAPDRQLVEAVHTEPGAGRPRICITTPAGLVSLMPYALGFQPGNCVVVFGTKGEGESGSVTLRIPLDDLDDSGLTASSAMRAVSILTAQEFTRAAMVGYGPEGSVTPFAGWFRDLAAEHGIEVSEVLRVADGRFWSYLCADPACCPPEGTPCRMTADPELAGQLPEGMPGVLQRREDLAARVTPVTGADAAAMRRAAKRAEARVTEQLNREPRPGRPSGRALVIAEGITAGQAAIERTRQGGDLTRGEAARLAVALREIQVRDDFWSRLEPKDRKQNLRLLLELTRLAGRAYVAPVATLLAFVAWQCGNGALVNVALDRALDGGPESAMAEMIRQAANAGAPPQLAKVPLTPEEVAAEHARRAAGAARQPGKQ